jgi:MFS family permease
MSRISRAAESPAKVKSFGSIVVLSLGALDFGLEASIVLPALPALARHYGASFVAIAWFATAFQLAAVAAVPLLGRLGDLLGKRRVLLVALTAFATGSLLCAITDSIGVAIAGRAIQGVGAAVGPLGLGIARDTLPRDRLPRAIGALVGGMTFGGAIGFLLSGLLVDQFSPASIFWFLFAFAGFLFVATVACVQESPERAPGDIDVGGALLVSAGLGALLLAISEGNGWGWSSGRIIGLLVAAAVLLALFAAVEARVSEPLVDLALVARRPFADANLCALLFGFALYLAVYVIPQIAARPRATGYGLALSTTMIGLLLTPSCVVGFAAAWAAGRLVSRVGPRALVVSGSAVGVAAYLSLALAHSSIDALAAGTAALGISWGLILTGVYAVVMGTVVPDASGVAAAVIVTMRVTGSAIGVQAAFALIAGAGVVGSFPAESGFTRAFLMGAVGAGVTLVAAAFLPAWRRSGPTREEAGSPARRTDGLARARWR